MRKRIGLPAAATAAMAIVVAVAAGASAFLANAAHPVVVFDEAHGQRFHIQGDAPLDLSNLAALVRAKGAAPELWTRPLTPGTLDGVSGLVISGPFRPIEDDEVKTITAFVERGGRLAVMLHIAMPAAVLLDRLGVQVSKTPVLEQENVIAGQPLNFEVTRLAPHALTKGIERFSVYGCFALNPKGPSTAALATTSAKAFIDRDGDGTLSPTDAVAAYAVAVTGTRGEGEFVAFGDDALFQNQFLLGNNRKLGENLAGFLAGR